MKGPGINIDVFLQVEDVEGVLPGEASVLDTAWEALAVAHTALKVIHYTPASGQSWMNVSQSSRPVDIVYRTYPILHWYTIIPSRRPKQNWTI